MRPIVNKVDVVAIGIVSIGLILGVARRSNLPAVPLWTPDTWGYLSPALSWLGGDGFQQANGREWLYPAILAATVKLGGEFDWIVRLQQCLSLLAAPLLWFCVRFWLSIFPRRSALFHGITVLLGALATFIYVLGTAQIQLELTICPEGLLAFFMMVYFTTSLAYFRARWVTRQSLSTIVFGAGMLLFCYTVILLRPSWSLAAVPVSCLLVAGVFGSGSLRLRLAPVATGLLLVGAEYTLPQFLQFKPDLGARTLLPFNLVEIHAAEIVENAKRHHLIESGARRSDNTETCFYDALEQAWEEARVRPLRNRMLGFDADYIQYSRKLFSTFQSERKLTDDALIKLCYHAYFRVWRDSPDTMVGKIARQFYLFLTAPSKDFSAYALDRRRFREIAAAVDPCIEASVAEARSRGYTDQPACAIYLGTLQEVYARGFQINHVAVQRYLAAAFAKASLWIQTAFFAVLLWVLSDRRFRDLRLLGYAAVLVTAGLYGNVLTISIVHTLDVERYRSSYAPALLLTLVIMTAFVIRFFEQLFHREKMEGQQRRETDNT